MTDQANDNQQANEPKKISLADAIKNKLEQKKLAQTTNKNNLQQRAGDMKMKSQQTKKVNNQRRRTGGS